MNHRREGPGLSLTARLRRLLSGGLGSTARKDQTPSTPEPDRPAGAGRPKAPQAFALFEAAVLDQSDARPPELLRDTVAQLDAGMVKELIGRAEAERPATDGERLPAWAKNLRSLDTEGPFEMPVLALRPGQTQLSFDHAAKKMLSLLKDIEDEAPKALSQLYDPRDFSAVVGPDGRFAVLRDGHHKMNGLLALSALLHGILGEAPKRVAKGLQPLAKLIPPPGELQVPVWIEGQEAKISAGQSMKTRLEDFFSRFDNPYYYEPPLYLNTRAGLKANLPPERMSDLEDNPFRCLAAELVSKFEWNDSGIPVFKKSETPLWLKGPDAPDYVDFHMAEVLEAASRAARFEFQVGQPIPEEVQEAFRTAVVGAQRADHPVLQRVISFEHETDWDKLHASLELLPHAVMDFGYSEFDLEGHEVPIVLLPSNSPDSHRLHAAARLHDALVAAGADLHAHAITPEIARNAIARLDTVHDDVGLWINTSGVTAAELRREAELAEAMGLALRRTKRSAIEVGEANPPSAPLWLNLPGLPASTPFVLGFGPLSAKPS